MRRSQEDRHARGQGASVHLEEVVQEGPTHWSKAHDSAVETYGEGERAHRTAFAALKHGFEKVGDRWVEKTRKGPSDPQDRKRGRSARRGGKTYGGIDVEGHTKDELYARAAGLGIPVRSKMTKHELAEAIARKQG